MAKSKDDKLVMEIIERYGATIDLKDSPYLIVEIIRQYGPRFGGGVAAECLPPGGAPKIFDPSEVMREIKANLKEVERLSKLLHEGATGKAR
ncbi:hypothetical protein LJR251_004102 [Rhizobium rhizogenes]|uniref:hypothetical protein n=1 Tax=Rhizobium rhizogenes TaxID=359 RepID=UPI003ECD8C7C